MEIGHLDPATGIVHPAPPGVPTVIAPEVRPQAEAETVERTLEVEEVDSPLLDMTPEPWPRTRSRSRSRIVRS